MKMQDFNSFDIRTAREYRALLPEGPLVVVDQAAVFSEQDNFQILDLYRKNNANIVYPATLKNETFDELKARYGRVYRFEYSDQTLQALRSLADFAVTANYQNSQPTADAFTDFLNYARNNKVAINQLVTSISFGDAITNCMLHLRDLIRSWGLESYIFCEAGPENLLGEWYPYTEHRKISASNNILLYHPNSGQSVLNNYFAQVPDRKMIYYHNITPGHFFENWNPELTTICNSAKQAIQGFRQFVSGAICDSNFNAEDLTTVGYSGSKVIPIPFSAERRFAGEPDLEILSRYQDGKVNILFVGRLCPNKAQDQLVDFFSFYSKQINSNSRLILVGSNKDGDKYADYVKSRVADLQLENVIFAGTVSESQLAAYYQVASVFLCFSEHEGFCVPLLEAMNFGVPIIAYNCSAIGETLGGSSIVIKCKDPLLIANWIEKLSKESEIRLKVVNSQKTRLNYFSTEMYANRLKKFFGEYSRVFQINHMLS